MYEIYNIKETDTLESIAKDYNTTKEELIKINGPQIITSEERNNQIIVPKKDTNYYEYYTVKKEETIYQIANNNNIDYNILLKINGLEKDDYIYPNQTIILPKKGINIYLTQENDTLNDIINKLKTDLNQLIKTNNTIYLKEEQIIIF
jgi:LysM repeat protein